MVNKLGKNNPPYPLDLRKKVCEALKNGMGTCEAARQFGVKPSTISKWKVLGELPKNTGRPTKKKPIQKANSQSSQENENIFQSLLTKLPLDNEIEAKNLAANYGVATAINYCRVVLCRPSVPQISKSYPLICKRIIKHYKDEL